MLINTEKLFLLYYTQQIISVMQFLRKMQQLQEYLEEMMWKKCME